eukprot:jgi/Undpi1/6408/HiC_scaffold_20.g08889.m1
MNADSDDNEALHSISLRFQGKQGAGAGAGAHSTYSRRCRDSEASAVLEKDELEACCAGRTSGEKAWDGTKKALVIAIPLLTASKHMARDATEVLQREIMLACLLLL